MTTNLMPSPAVETFDTAILARTIYPTRKSLPPGIAEEILQWDFSPEDKRRMGELSVKANEGELSAQEEEEIDSYIRVGHIVNLMQAKARLAIKQGARD
ncbi:MAG TPA: hypothetical protein VGI40_07140 [Pirellulaceae bacterium]|jgi:hypothetical protein